MDSIDVTDGFDVHDYRSKLKLLRQTADSMTLDNRGGLACPACERAFDRLFVGERAAVSFERPPAGPFCVVRTEDRTLVVAH